MERSGKAEDGENDPGFQKNKSGNHHPLSFLWRFQIIDIGVEFLSTMQQVGSMNPFEIKDEFGDRVAFKGGLDTQQLLPNGTPEEVREGVKDVIRAYAPGGGYVFMPAHMLYPDVPTENIWAMLEAVKWCKYHERVVVATRRSISETK
jgi:uroporphyrinogen-III decarboxylase